MTEPEQQAPETEEKPKPQLRSRFRKPKKQPVNENIDDFVDPAFLALLEQAENGGDPFGSPPKSKPLLASTPPSGKRDNDNNNEQKPENAEPTEPQFNEDDVPPPSKPRMAHSPVLPKREENLPEENHTEPQFGEDDVPPPSKPKMAQSPVQTERIVKPKEPEPLNEFGEDDVPPPSKPKMAQSPVATNRNEENHPEEIGKPTEEPEKPAESAVKPSPRKKPSRFKKPQKIVEQEDDIALLLAMDGPPKKEEPIEEPAKVEPESPKEEGKPVVEEIPKPDIPQVEKPVKKEKHKKIKQEPELPSMDHVNSLFMDVPKEEVPINNIIPNEETPIQANVVNADCNVEKEKVQIVIEMDVPSQEDINESPSANEDISVTPKMQPPKQRKIRKPKNVPQVDDLDLLLQDKAPEEVKQPTETEEKPIETNPTPSNEMVDENIDDSQNNGLKFEMTFPKPIYSTDADATIQISPPGPEKNDNPRRRTPPSDLIELHTILQKKFSVCVKQAKSAFPATINQEQLIIKFLTQSALMQELNEVEANMKAAEKVNDKLRIEPTPEAATSLAMREAKNLKHKLQVAEQYIIKLQNTDDANAQSPNKMQAVYFDESSIPAEQLVDLTRQKEFNQALENEVQFLEDKLSSLEKRIQLMTQKSSTYSAYFSSSGPQQIPPVEAG